MLPEQPPFGEGQKMFTEELLAPTSLIGTALSHFG
jgi:hypothetical protein